MSTVSPSEIRQAVASTLATLSGWRESRWPFELIGYDPDQYVHRSFAVGLPSSAEVRRTDRQKSSVLVTTDLAVRFLYRLRGDNLRNDYDSALDAEILLTKQIMTNPPTHTHVVFRGVQRTVDAEAGYYVGTISVDVYHMYALT